MPDSEKPTLDAESVFRALGARRVSFVVIGGMAAILRGAPITTGDLDIVPDRDVPNLDALALALLDMHAVVRFGGRVRDFGTGEWLTAERTWNLDTDFGILDLLFEPSGGGVFGELATRAQNITVADRLAVLVASLDDLIAMKEAAGRTKDLLVLPILRWLKEREATDE